MKYFYMGVKTKKGLFEFWKEYMMYVYGNAYVEIKRNKKNKIISKNILNSAEVYHEFKN